MAGAPGSAQARALGKAQGVILRTGVIGIVGTLVICAAALLPTAVGQFLVVADPLDRADAVFVLSGGTPVRELEAAALYHRKIAPRVVLSNVRDLVPPHVRFLSGMSAFEDVAVLKRVRVPALAVVRLTSQIENTRQELHVDFEHALAHGYRRVVIVTSPQHTRRVRMMWNAISGGRVAAAVYPTSYEAFDPGGWWRSRRGLEVTLHELGGIVHFWLGSPLPSYDPTH